jgi:serine/threonine protein phosphatase 1
MVAVIGDIHGCYYTLVELYNKIKSKYPDIPIYSVGDLVDRGNNSFETVEFIKKNEIKFTAGNHDLMFYYFFKKPTHPIGQSWIYNGSETTLDSYGNHMEKVNEHLDYIINAPLFIDLDDCFISHAGISSYYQKQFKKGALVDLEKLNKVLNNDIGSEHSVIWSRDVLMNLGKLQIVGHTRQQEVYHDEKSDALYIDTSPFTGNKLSAVLIEKSKVIETFTVTTLENDLNEQYA